MAPAGKGSTREKPRPRPLNLEALKLPLPEWCHDEMPVRKTFIDYRCPEESPRGGRIFPGLNTAPAAMCGCMLASLEEAVLSPRCSDRGQRATDVLPEAGSAASTARKSSASSSSSQASQPPAEYRISPEKSTDCQDTAGRQEESATKLHIHNISTDEDCGSSADEDEEEELNICPVYTADAALPSIGSAKHAEGACRRCCFFPKGRCNNGKDCMFCHFSHEKRRSKPKPKKSKRLKKRVANACEEGKELAGVGGADSIDGSYGQATPVPVSIVLQTAIPEGSQPSGQGYSVAIVSVPFCVGAY
ncbi:unnamed protein product [Symbiodinium natans]|uniref:C3H1-type domain-containing protein n=1 Tax=Symbiodinium natans TaxID=878477 RepID=A0A812RW02_9DINO|nr:unnamed protein product [Symbiodinium natans]